jgi:hypothetical protein
LKNVTQSRPTHLEADHIFPDELDEGTDPNIMVVGMTHSSLSAEMAAMIGTGKAVQFCRSCHEQHQAADACGAVLKSWHEGWRITCPVCCSPLSEGARPRSGDDTIRDTSPFSKNWDTAINGIVMSMSGRSPSPPRLR